MGDLKGQWIFLDLINLPKTVVIVKDDISKDDFVSMSQYLGSCYIGGVVIVFRVKGIIRQCEFHERFLYYETFTIFRAKNVSRLTVSLTMVLMTSDKLMRRKMVVAMMAVLLP